MYADELKPNKGIIYVGVYMGREYIRITRSDVHFSPGNEVY